jgi:hypothetical protein
MAYIYILGFWRPTVTEKIITPRGNSSSKREFKLCIICERRVSGALQFWTWCFLIGREPSQPKHDEAIIKDVLYH